MQLIMIRNKELEFWIQLPDKKLIKSNTKGLVGDHNMIKQGNVWLV